ncbi:MAG TPA: hypothetical protein VGM05_03830, partial [Planctomycetaceae bacterium]
GEIDRLLIDLQPFEHEGQAKFQRMKEWEKEIEQEIRRPQAKLDELRQNFVPRFFPCSPDLISPAPFAFGE